MTTPFQRKARRILAQALTETSLPFAETTTTGDPTMTPTTDLSHEVPADTYLDNEEPTVDPSPKTHHTVPYGLLAEAIKSAPTTQEIAAIVDDLLNTEPLLSKVYPTRKAARKAARRFNREFNSFIAYLAETSQVIRILPPSEGGTATYEFQHPNDPTIVTLYLAPYKASTIDDDHHVLASIVQQIEITTPEPVKKAKRTTKKVKEEPTTN